MIVSIINYVCILLLCMLFIDEGKVKDEDISIKEDSQLSDEQSPASSTGSSRYGISKGYTYC